MRTLSALAAAVVATAALACANTAYPPGGPEDHVPPKLVSVTPESGSVNARPKTVVFQFDEVVNDRGTGPSSLRSLFLLSPRDGDAHVDWHRSSVTVHGRRDWRPNTVYTVTMLPGVADIRNNASKERRTVSFSTGPSFPDGHLAGVVYDWARGRGIPNAFIEAVRRPDSTVFITQADSSGRFDVPFLNAATYVVFGYLDANNNRGRDPREPYDSLIVAVGAARDTATLALKAFVHDTIGPGFTTVEVRDSVTLRVTFDQPILAATDTAFYRLQSSDSARVTIASVVSADAFDKAAADSAARADSIRKRDSLPVTQVPLPPTRRNQPDTTKRVEPAVLAGPLPITTVILKVAVPFKVGASYRLEGHGLRNLLGKSRVPSRVFLVPRPPKPIAADSLRRRAPADSAAARRPPAGAPVRRPPR